MKRWSSRAPVLAGALSLLLPITAIAHRVSTGIGPVIDGGVHFLLSIDAVLPIVASALLAGLQGPAAARQMLWTLPCAWIVGSAVGAYLGPEAAVPVIRTAITLGVGLLIVADRRILRFGTVIIVACAGAAAGYGDGAEESIANGGVPSVLGAVALAFIASAYVSALVVSANSPMARTIVRVAGSWIAATALLMLGWSLRS